MASGDLSKILALIREAVMDQSYLITPHAVIEMRDDDLDVLDVESAILTGTIQRVFDHDRRGRRYEVVGHATDLTTEVGVIVRFAGQVLIVTVYEIHP